MRSEYERIAWQSGYDDYQSGYSIGDNPYWLISTWESNAWIRGWERAEADAGDEAWSINSGS